MPNTQRKNNTETRGGKKSKSKISRTNANKKTYGKNSSSICCE